MAMLEVRDLQVYYGVICALKGISFDVEEGQIVSLIGANGAGRTTMMQSIVGLIPKLAGTVTLGKSTWVGIGATVSNNTTICGGCMIGAGAVVVKDILEPGTYVGVPARRLQ